IPIDCTLIIAIPSQLAMPAAAHPAAAGSGEAMTEPGTTRAMGEAPVEAVMETVVETIEALHDEDRRCQAEIPWPEIPRGAPPIWKVVGISIIKGRGIEGGGRRRDVIDLRRQTRRILGDPPATVGLLAGFDDRLLRLAADRQRRGVAAAGGFRRGG